MRDADMRDRLLDAAERRVRAGGYHGFSFRDVAVDVGIRSSSVHHHFPTKADLAQALAHRYTEAALRRLGPPQDLPASEAVRRVVALFRDALLVENRMCLCGLLGAERDALPPEVLAEVAGYFRALLAWLRAALGPNPSGPSPESLIARLEGALILARSLGDPAVFDRALEGVEEPEPPLS